jgi:hypothetical protein
MDTDVLDEAARVAKTKDDSLQIKVNHLRKVYLRGSGPCSAGSLYVPWRTSLSALVKESASLF